jgi:DNA-directed RNA polymerase alpha subunit
MKTHDLKLTRREFKALGLSIRAQNALINANVLTIDDLAALTPEALAEIPAIGPKTFLEVIDARGRV